MIKSQTISKIILLIVLICILILIYSTNKKSDAEKQLHTLKKSVEEHNSKLKNTDLKYNYQGPNKFEPIPFNPRQSVNP